MTRDPLAPAVIAELLLSAMTTLRTVRGQLPNSLTARRQEVGAILEYCRDSAGALGLPA